MDKQKNMDKNNNILFFKTIKKSKNYRFFYENLKKMIYFKPLKENETAPDFYFNFLENFISLALSVLDLDEVNVYFDKNLTNKTVHHLSSSFSPYAYTNFKGEIFLPEHIFQNKNKNIFSDMFSISHELKHAQITKNNEKIVRKIGSVSDKFVYGTQYPLLRKLGFNDDDILIFYVLNHEEILANKFAYDFVINLIDSSMIFNEKNKDNKEFGDFVLDQNILRVYKDTILNLYAIQQINIEKCKDYYDIVLIPAIKSKQSQLLKELEDFDKQFVLNVSQKKDFNEIFLSINDTIKKIITSLEIYFNENLIENIRKFINVKNKQNISKLPLSIDFLNAGNVVPTIEDFENHIKICENLKIPVNFDYLNLDKQNLIENYLKFKCNFDNIKLKKDEILNMLEIEKIETSDDFFKQIYDKTKIKKSQIEKSIKNQ